MAWILLHGPEGTRRIPENTPYRLMPGEQVVGSELDLSESELNDRLAEEKMGLGDFVEKAIKLIPETVRPVHCTKCEKKKLVLNKVRELGVVETFRQLWEIK